MSLAQRAEANSLASLRVYAHAAGGTVSESPGLFAMTSPANIRAFNQIILKRVDDTTPTDLSHAVAARAGGKLRLRARETTIGDNERLILDAGLEAQGGIPSLALTAVDLDPSAVDIDIRKVGDEASLAHHTILVAASFDFDLALLSSVFTPVLLEDPRWSAYVGYVDDGPVATTQLVVAEGVAGIYYVGTADAHRGRGYGDALTRHAIIEGAKLGRDISTLQASSAGYPVYKHMGFEDCGYYRSYVNAAH